MLTVDINFLDAKKFDPSKHPRGQPENAGEFAKKGRGVRQSNPKREVPEADAIGSYKASGAINSWLAAGQPKTKSSAQFQAMVNTLDRLVASRRLTKPSEVYRSTADLSPEDQQKLMSGRGVLQNPAYTSVTWQREVAEMYNDPEQTGQSAYVMRIELPKGFNLYDLPGNEDGYNDEEAILPRGLSFQVKSVDTRNMVATVVPVKTSQRNG